MSRIRHCDHFLIFLMNETQIISEREENRDKEESDGTRKELNKWNLNATGSLRTHTML